jgi:Flp pilus assembly protein TadG
MIVHLKESAAMLVRKHAPAPRRGMSAVESAVVYPLTILLIVGTLVVGLGVFRYQQLQSLAREASRYASVRGPGYVAAQSGNTEATTSSVLSYVQGLAVGLSGLECTEVTYSSATTPCTVTVTLSYTWRPEGFFGSRTWIVTSTDLVTY